MPTSGGASLRRECNSLLRDGQLTCPAESTAVATMKRSLARPVFALAIPLSATAAPHPAVYQDGVLTKVRTTVVGNSCSASTQSDASTYGNTARRTLDASARCSDIRGAVYTIEAAGTEYELTPDHSRVARVSAYLPLSAVILRQSSLANHMPGTQVKFRRDNDGFLVLVGKRESHYHAFVAR